jgi:hypothetical protein
LFLSARAGVGAGALLELGLKNPPSPSGCPTPCVLLEGMSTFIDLLFIILLAAASVSSVLLCLEIRDPSRR